MLNLIISTLSVDLSFNLMKLIGMRYSPGPSLLQPNRRMANSVMVAVMMMVKLMAL